MRAAVAVLLCLLPPLAAAGEFHKCTVDGRTVYQAGPCAPGAGERVELAPINSLGDRKAPVATRKPAGEVLPPAPPGKPPVAPLVAGPGWYTGADGYRQAQEESRRSGLPLLIYFYTDWCPHCRNFDARVLPDPAVEARLARFVKVRLNIDAGPGENRLHKDMGGRGIPYVLVQKPGGKPARISHAPQPKRFAAVLDTL